MTGPSLDLDALREKAEKATKHRWTVTKAEWIAAASPDVILAVLALVEEQRDRIAALEKRVGPFDPETETCQECGLSFPTVWHVHNEAWTAATGYGGNDDGGCFCIDCFQRKHDATGRPFLHWEAREGAWPSCAGSPCPEEETMVRQGEWLEREHTEIRRLQSENERLREALEASADLHHRTLNGSRLHDPEHIKSFRDCPSLSCRAARAALGAQ